jgi:hypothetical protein
MWPLHLRPGSWADSIGRFSSKNWRIQTSGASSWDRHPICTRRLPAISSFPLFIYPSSIHPNFLDLCLPSPPPSSQSHEKEGLETRPNFKYWLHLLLLLGVGQVTYESEPCVLTWRRKFHSHLLLGAVGRPERANMCEASMSTVPGT